MGGSLTVEAPEGKAACSEIYSSAFPSSRCTMVHNPFCLSAYICTDTYFIRTLYSLGERQKESDIPEFWRAVALQRFSYRVSLQKSGDYLAKRRDPRGFT
jgi:hypothetical protein